MIHCQAPDHKVAVVNFADRETPGGQLMQGAKGQQESICVRATLRRSLDAELCPLNPDEILYSKQVKVLVTTPGETNFCPSNTFSTDIISAAAIRNPAIDTLAAKPQYVDPATKVQVSNQIRLILRAAAKNGAQTVILGAIGCGRAGHHPALIADITITVLSDGTEDWEAGGIEKVLVVIKSLETMRGV